MADATVSRLGQSNQTGSSSALFLEVFSGEVLAALDTAQVTMGRHRTKSISSGKSAQFPFIWKSSARFHTPGTEISGTPITHAARTISIEQLLIADVFVADIDEAMNHYESRREYAKQLGEALGNAWDTNVFRANYLGGEVAADSLFTGNPGGTQITDADFITTPGDLKAGIYDAAQTLDEKNVPASGRYVALKPAEFYGLLENGEFVHRDYAGEGSKARAKMPFVADLQVLKSNNIPRSNDTSNTDIPSSLRANFSTNVAHVWHEDGVATVKLIDLKVESEYDIRRQGTLFVAKYAMGVGYLRPESNVSLATS